jgi:hypothetical protein
MRLLESPIANSFSDDGWKQRGPTPILCWSGGHARARRAEIADAVSMPACSCWPALSSGRLPHRNHRPPPPNQITVSLLRRRADVSEPDGFNAFWWIDDGSRCSTPSGILHGRLALVTDNPTRCERDRLRRRSAAPGFRRHPRRRHALTVSRRDRQHCPQGERLAAIGALQMTRACGQDLGLIHTRGTMRHRAPGDQRHRRLRSSDNNTRQRITTSTFFQLRRRPTSRNLVRAHALDDATNRWTADGRVKVK